MILMSVFEARHKMCPIFKAVCYANACMSWQKSSLDGTIEPPHEKNNRIDWIRWYREKTGCTLKHAKDISDNLLEGKVSEELAKLRGGYGFCDNPEVSRS